MADDESGKKHLLIEVPEHVSQSGDEKRTMTTFLRMGTFDPDAPGMDLLEDFEAFYDDERDRGRNEAGEPAGSPGHDLTVAERKAETARLFTRGGWQDHSDGNRLTSTRGDKLEVIRGNYKLLVLGRQDDHDHAAALDFSGGLTEDDAVYPPAYCEWKWVQTWGGTWKLTQVEEKTDVHEIVHGNLKEEFYGDTIESIVGAESDASDVAHAQESSKKKRPDIIEKTWASSITSSTGSVLMPVPTITETTFAGAIAEATTAAAITETVTSGALSSVTAVSGAIVETVTAGSISEATTASSLTSTSTITTITETTTATTVKDTLKSGTLSETVTVGAASSQEFYGVRNEFMTAGAHSDVSLVGAQFGFTLGGVMLDIELSALRGEIKAGLGFFEIEAAIIYVELFIGIKMEIKLGGEIKYDTTSKEFSLEKTVGIGLG